MIEGPGGAPTPPPRRPLRAPDWTTLAAQARGLLEDVWRRLQPRGGHDRGDAFLAQLQLVSQVFWVVLIGLTCYLVFEALGPGRKLPVLKVAAVAPAGSEAPVQPAGGDLQASAEEYRRTLAERNPFRLATEHVVEALPGGHPAAKRKLMELTADLTVVGINRGAVPEALVEDSKAKRTYFLKVGDQVNGLTISSIDQSGVMVSYEGEETLLQ